MDFLGGSAVPVLDALHARSPAERERKIIEYPYLLAYPVRYLSGLDFFQFHATVPFTTTHRILPALEKLFNENLLKSRGRKKE